MHEASLAAAILQLVESQARQQPFARVTRLRLEVGTLAGVEVEALEFALQALSPGTLLQGARIEMATPAGTARCRKCGRTVAIQTRIQPCPACGGYPLEPITGAQLRVLELIVED